MANNETPFHIYLQGKRFEDAALVITAAMQQNPSLAPLIIPVSVNGVLSVELYFKSILLKENGKYPKTHDLVELFSSLTQGSKDKITERYNMEHRNSQAVTEEQIKLIERETGLQIKGDLDSVIADASKTFVQ